MDGTTADPPPRRAVALLFVASTSAHSVIALANLREALADTPAGDVPEVHVIDVLQAPAKALEYRVYITPSLILTITGEDQRESRTTMIGDLSDVRRVTAFLTQLINPPEMLGS